MAFKITAIATILAIAFAVPNASAAPRLADKSAVAFQLEQHAKAGGVPVIVRLQDQAPPPAQSSMSDEARERASFSVTQPFVDRFFGDRAVSSKATQVRRMRFFPLVAFTATESDLRKLVADPAVEAIFLDNVAKLSLNQSVPKIGMPRLWSAQDGRGKGEGTVVAILDAGVQSDHPFLGGRVVHQACFSSTTDGFYPLKSLCPNGGPSQIGGRSGEPCRLDGCDHGTHLAGIAAGLNPKGRVTGEPRMGVAPKAEIVSILVVSDAGGDPRSSDSNWIAALEHVYAIRNGLGDGKRLVAVNMSFNSPQNSPGSCDDHPARAIIQLLRRAGVAVIGSAGNDSLSKSLTPPACIPEVIAVGNTTKHDLVEESSNVSPKVALFAPGTDILSSIRGGKYEAMTGTSMAAPAVAGAFAALSSIAPHATVDEMLASLARSGKPIRDVDNKAGIVRPRIQVDRAMRDLRLRNSNLLASPSAPILRQSEDGRPQSFQIILRAKSGTEKWRLLSKPDWIVAPRRIGTATQKSEHLTFRLRPLGPRHTERTGWLVFGLAPGKPTRIIRVDQRRAASR